MSTSTFPAAAIRVFWSYIMERESIRLRKAAGEPAPWTDDPILQKYKFTNVRRIHDRTTRAFLTVYQSHAKAPAAVALYNCGVHRFFGTAEFPQTAGWQERHDREDLRQAVKACPRPYTGAYMVRADGNMDKVDAIAGYLSGLWAAAPKVTDAIKRTRTWEAGYRELVKVRCFGSTGFVSKEVLQDYLLWLHFAVKDANTWTPVGPGARRGLCRLLNKPTAINGWEGFYVESVQELQAAIQPLWRKAFPKEPPLTTHDIQFCLSEVDKYLLAKNGEGRPRSTYSPTARAA